MRDLHKGHERDERDKQRAKDEVDRLNGVVSASGSKREGAPSERRPAIPPASVNGNQQVTPADRKRQLTQLAEMGVAIPEDFRREMAMVGDWQTTSEKLIYEDDFVKKEEAGDVKPGLNVGVRKRKFEGQEEEEEAGETVVRRGWGSTIRVYPGPGGDENDLSTLLKSTKRVIRDGEALQRLGSGDSSLPEEADSRVTIKETQPGLDSPTIMKEESVDSVGVSDTVPHETAVVQAPPESVKQEENPPDSGVIFKKRKAKSIRQK